MAAVSLSPLPYDVSSMSSRRAPLSSNANAINSPYRAAPAAASKQKRSYAHTQREDAYGQPPPAKKQMLDTHVSRTPPRQLSTHSFPPEGRILTRKSNAQFTSFERRTATSTREVTQQSVKKSEKTPEQDLETIRKWQKHYQKIFPTYVFYFESVPEDLRAKYTKQVVALGAREEKFFSNAVTHVVTTRAIPTQDDPSTNTSETAPHNSQPQTINPSLLDRSSESINTAHELGAKAKFTFDVPINRRPPPHGHEDVKRQQGRSSDLLHKARALGMKIWALEKLQRMMTTMFDTETGDQATGHNTRSHTVSNSIPRSARETDLSKLLRNERINGPSDRDPTVVTKELILFKGPYIYVHDIDEKQKPIMVREYSKVAHKELGDWPQFRSVSNGRCPFVGEIDYDQRDAEREKERHRIQRQEEKEKGVVPRTRAAAAVEANKMQPPKSTTAKRLFGVERGTTRNMTVPTNQVDPFAPAKFPNPQHTERESSSRGNQNAFISRAGAGRLFAGEPVASGVQPNITSAIRSQISSTAAQPGARVGTNKEFYGLQRKVLEKNSGGPGSYGLASSHRLTDAITVTREDLGNQAAKRKNQQALTLIEEDAHPSEAEETARRTVMTRKAKADQQRRVVKRDAKPGYCENCQDKFEDFDEHVISHKHRKFAEKLDNWKDLDELLSKLARLPRGTNEDEY